jgi:hypothetical protein
MMAMARRDFSGSIYMEFIDHLVESLFSGNWIGLGEKTFV